MDKEKITAIAKENRDFAVNVCRLYDIRNNNFDAMQYVFEEGADLTAIEENQAMNCVCEINKILNLNQQELLDLVDRFFDDEIEEIRP